MDLFELNDKVALVTGALGLIGKEHCKALAHAGATVIVADLNESACHEFAQTLGNGSMGIGMDISFEPSVQLAASWVKSQFGHVDILVNNAAINDHFQDSANVLALSSFENYPLSMFKKSWEVNVMGMFLVSQKMGQLMLEKGGSIINIASTYGMVGPDQGLYKDETGKQVFYKTPAYPTTKGAVINFTRYLAAYWGDKGIRVNTLSPGGVENGQSDYFIQQYIQKTPLKRMAKASDYAGALLFLASDASAYMTGANLVVDGGFTAI
ncbi:SDR family oxidoreductase [Aquirufa ecclesiirivi]|uniref:SDR family oxidoreductase n=1 Tax=Aquirufa ecclesiirivi TaxID=2715124 RepID=UPI00140E41EC|nr:SDR family oxidoreductase [Aquirufa ecclesiirivi]NHC47734.1 SDR family oxidoreductase [Aquirufa ecclesiirivi]